MRFIVIIIIIIIIIIIKCCSVLKLSCVHTWFLVGLYAVCHFAVTLVLTVIRWKGCVWMKGQLCLLQVLQRHHFICFVLLEGLLSGLLPLRYFSLLAYFSWVAVFVFVAACFSWVAVFVFVAACFSWGAVFLLLHAFPEGSGCFCEVKKPFSRTCGLLAFWPNGFMFTIITGQALVELLSALCVCVHLCVCVSVCVCVCVCVCVLRAHVLCVFMWVVLVD